MDETKKLLEDRRSIYGDSWKMSGAITRAIQEFGGEAAFVALFNSDYDWPWNAILNKLTRLLASPDHIDSWKDIEGYARLVREDLEAQAPKATYDAYITKAADEIAKRVKAPKDLRLLGERSHGGFK